MLTRPLLTFLALLVCSAAYSQTQKGGYMLGGNGSFGYNSVEVFYVDQNIINDNEQTSIGASLNPNVSYFLWDNLAVGIVSGLNITYSKNLYTNYNHRFNRFTYVSLGPQIRYYFPFQRFAIFPQVQYLLRRESERRDNINPITNLPVTDRTQRKIGNLQLGIGGAYFITHSMAVEGLLNYNVNKVLGETLPIGQYSLNTRQYFFNLNVGLQFYFNRKH